jgi:hypothetical protein
VSYRVNDNSLDKALKIYDRLVNSTPIHASPFEHQAKASEFRGYFMRGEYSYQESGTNGNFKNWIQYRQLL